MSADGDSVLAEFALENLREEGGALMFDGAAYGQLAESAVIGMPADARPVAAVVSKTERRIPLSSFPGAAGLPDSYRPPLAEARALGYFRDQYLGSLLIRPIGVEGGELVVVERCRVRVDFMRGSGPRVVSTEPLPPSQGFDAARERLLLNSGQAERWRVGRARPRFAPSLPQQASSGRVKILILETALYRIVPSDLIAAGAEEGSIESDTLRMTRQGIEVPVDVTDPNENGIFDGTDVLIFYGDRVPHNRYSVTNAFLLEWGGERGLRPEVRDGKPTHLDAPQPRAFRAPRFFEDNVFHHILENEQNDQIDHYFWSGFTGVTRKAPLVYDFPNEANDIGLPAIMRIQLHGGQNSKDPHEFAVYIGQNRIGRLNWDGQEAKYGTMYFPQQLIAGQTGISFASNDQNGTQVKANNYDILLDWFEIDYWRNMEYGLIGPYGAYISDQLYPAVASGPTLFRIGGCPTENPLVYEIVDNGLVSKFQNFDAAAQAGEPVRYLVSFEADWTPSSRYAVVRYTDVKVPYAVQAAPPSGLRSPTIKGDYLIVTHPNFMEALQPLKEHRESQGFHVVVADVNQIYNDFNHGRFSPFAIKTFLRSAFQSWEIPPEYVLLAGDGHYNYKGDNQDYFTKQIYPVDDGVYVNFVPTIHGWSEGGLEGGGETSMDHRFATIAGNDSLPDLHIGRLPVHTAAEMRSVVEKIIAYETQTDPDPAWRARVIHISDNRSTHNGDHVFRTSRENLIRWLTPPSYEVEKIYLRDKAPSSGRWDPPEEEFLPTSGDANLRIVEAVRDGALILEYAGHGGRGVWADEDILRTTDILRMRNDSRHPLVIATTCLINAFDTPEQVGDRSMGEEFLLSRGAGACAVIGATRKTYANCNVDFDNLFFPLLFNHPSNRIGELLTFGKIEAAAFAVGEPSLYCLPGLEQYTLLGDPAGVLQRPELSVTAQVDPKAVDLGQPARMLQGIVFDPASAVFEKAGQFNGELQITIDFPGNLDPFFHNNRPALQRTVPVIGGEFLDSPEIRIPDQLASTGEAALRLFALSDDGETAAVGGAWFSIGQARILSVSSERSGDLLFIRAEAVHPEGPEGIARMTAHWKSTENHIWKETAMRRVSGSLYEVEEGIELPGFGRSVAYYVEIEDAGGRPGSVSGNQVFRMPEGPNLAVRQIGATRIPELYYGFHEELQKWAFTATIVNLGDHRPETWFETIIIEGSADVDFDGVLDEDPPPNILARAEIHPHQWLPGDTENGEWEQTQAVFELEKPLSSGFHDITVWVDPETADREDDRVLGRVAESREGDNITRKPFEVSDFFIGEEDASAYSLDRTFYIDVPKEAAPSPTTLSVTLVPPLDAERTNAEGAPYGQIEYLRIRNNDKTGFQIQLQSGETEFNAPATLRIGFNYEAMRDDVARDMDLPYSKLQWSGAQAVAHHEESQRALENLSAYRWDEEHGAWRRIDSELELDFEGNPRQRAHVTPPLYNNLESGNVRFHGEVEVDGAIGPTGRWAVLFVSHTEYFVLFNEGEGTTYTQLLAPGRLDEPYKDESVYLRHMLVKNVPPGAPSSAASYPAQPGDVLTFETAFEGGFVTAKNYRYSNAGNGIATLSLRANVTVETAPYGDWFVFFISPNQYEIRDQDGSQIINTSGRAIYGAVDGPEINVSNIGLQFQAFRGSRPFVFGDIARARIGRVMNIHADTESAGIFTLLRDKDQKPPETQIFVDNETPPNGSVIEPQPETAFLLTDRNGIDLHSIRLLRRSPGQADFQVVSPDQYIVDAERIDQVSLRYDPVLHVGEHAFRLQASDLAGWAAPEAEFYYAVERPPDFDPPSIALHSEEGVVPDGHVFTQTPQSFTLAIEDNHILDVRSLELTMEREGEEPYTPEPLHYEFQRPDPKTARITWSADLPNGRYAIAARMLDVTENSGYLSGDPDEPFRFTIEEPTRLIGPVLNAPNPFSPFDPVTRGTFFSYALTQPAESVTLQVYTSAGRLVKTIDDAPAERGRNERRWDGRSDDGELLSNGVYYYRFRMESTHFDKRETQERIGKLVIVR